MSIVDVEPGHVNQVSMAPLVDNEQVSMAALAAQTQGQGPESATPERAQRRTSLLARHDAHIDRDAHRVSGSQYVILAVWLGLLLALYLWARIVCWMGAPPNCKPDDDIVKVMNDFQFLLLAGFVLAVLTGLHWPDRFQYVFDFKNREGPCPRSVTFLFACFLMTGLWGCLDFVPGFSNFTFTTDGLSGWHISLAVFFALGAIALVAWHFWRAFAKNSRAGFFAYVFSRVAILTFYGAFGVAAMTNDNVDFHLHHYLIGFLLASLAEFNHPISLLLLAIGTGLFVQGVSAYHATLIITRPQMRLVIGMGQNASIGTGHNASPPMSQDAADWALGHCLLWNTSATRPRGFGLQHDSGRL